MKRATARVPATHDASTEGSSSFKDFFGAARKSVGSRLDLAGGSIETSIQFARDSTGDGLRSLREVTVDRVSDAKDNAVDKLAPISAAGRTQLRGLKEESSDIKKIFQSKDLTFFKTKSFAIVLRKLGGLSEFLEECDKLTKEGYRLVFREPVETIFEIPIPGVHTPLGTFYYFQHVKYITR